MKYHVTPEWDGGNLQTAAKRFGEVEAIEMFIAKWNCDDASFAADQVAKIYLYGTIDEAMAHQAEYGGEVLEIDDEYLEIATDYAEGQPVLCTRNEIRSEDIKRIA